MPKRTNRHVETHAATVVATPAIESKKTTMWKVGVQVVVSYYGHVIVRATNSEKALDTVWEMKDRTLEDLGDTVYRKESNSYLLDDATQV